MIKLNNILPKVKSSLTLSRILRILLFLAFFIGGLMYDLGNILIVLLVSIALTGGVVLMLAFARVVLWEEW